MSLEEESAPLDISGRFVIAGALDLSGSTALKLFYFGSDVLLVRRATDINGILCLDWMESEEKYIMRLLSSPLSK